MILRYVVNLEQSEGHVSTVPDKNIILTISFPKNLVVSHRGLNSTEISFHNI